MEAEVGLSALPPKPSGGLHDERVCILRNSASVLHSVPPLLEGHDLGLSNWCVGFLAPALPSSTILGMSLRGRRKEFVLAMQFRLLAEGLVWTPRGTCCALELDCAPCHDCNSCRGMCGSLVEGAPLGCPQGDQGKATNDPSTRSWDVFGAVWQVLAFQCNLRIR